jgi:hypothetical protein
LALKGLLDNSWFLRVVLVLWLVSAVFVLYLLGRVDWIVHHELYNYGLQFSLEWASPYWSFLRSIYTFLVVPIFLSVAYFSLEVWRFIRGGRIVASHKSSESFKPTGVDAKASEQNHMVTSCPKCRRVFKKPLVMLDFTSGRVKLVNVCPYCNHVLGGAEEK